MLYVSKEPRVVGEFDATMIHQRIDEVTSQNPNATVWNLGSQICDHVDFPDKLRDLINTHRAPLSYRRAFINTGVSLWEGLEYMHPGRNLENIDGWHVDIKPDRRLPLQEILTAASRWPTEFLLGKLSLTNDLRLYEPSFWKSEVGREVIEDALLDGDVRIHKFSPGDVLKVPKGTIHRRHVPSDEEGFRFFMRSFPRHANPARAGTVRGRMRQD